VFIQTLKPLAPATTICSIASSIVWRTLSKLLWMQVAHRVLDVFRGLGSVPVARRWCSARTRSKSRASARNRRACTRNNAVACCCHHHAPAPTASSAAITA